MTRLAILADIHGNLPALQAVMEDMQAFSPDHVIVAGDLINPAPFSREVLEIVTREKWAAIRGNHEYYLLHYNSPRQPDEWKDWTMPPWLYDQLKGKYYNIIAAMPDSLTLYYHDAPPVRVEHALPNNPWKAISRITPEDEIEKMLAGVEETTYVAGHYHLSFERRVGKWHILNPGSLGMPLDGCNDACYMILDGNENGWTPTFRRVPVDYTPIYEEYERQNFFERCGVMGYLMYQGLKTSRTIVASFGRWKKDHYPNIPPTIPMVDEFLESGRLWDYISEQYRFNC